MKKIARMLHLHPKYENNLRNHAALKKNQMIVEDSKKLTNKSPENDQPFLGGERSTAAVALGVQQEDKKTCSIHR